MADLPARCRNSRPESIPPDAEADADREGARTHVEQAEKELTVCSHGVSV